MPKHVKKVRGLKILTRKHPAVQALMDAGNAPEIHGDKVWPSSYFLMDFLDDNPPEENTSILELGCGWGALSLYCAKQFKANVLATDADRNVFPLLKLLARENEVKVKTRVCKFKNISDKVLAQQDLVLGGDICFWDDLVDELHKTIRRALANGVKTVVIADPGRPTFFDLAERCRKDFKAYVISYAIVDPSYYDGYLLIVNR